MLLALEVIGIKVESDFEPRLWLKTCLYESNNLTVVSLWNKTLFTGAGIIPPLAKCEVVAIRRTSVFDGASKAL